jgi:hypothetical protein
VADLKSAELCSVEHKGNRLPFQNTDSKINEVFMLNSTTMQQNKYGNIQYFWKVTED